MKFINIFTIIGLLSSFSTFAQPIINVSNFPANSQSTIYTVTEDNLINLSAGNSGPNQIWDYSGVTLNEIYYYDICCEEIAPISSFYAQLFPNANYCISVSSIEGSNYKKFYNISENIIELVGSYSSNPNDPVGSHAYYLSNYSTFMEFPYIYNSTFNDTFQFENGNPSTTIINNYDSYGTLITPFATYHNVIRNKITGGNSVEFIWYNSDPFFEIMNIQSNWSGNNLISNYSQIRKNLTFLGVQENKEISFSLYPNPTSNILMIDTNYLQKDLSLKVYDVLGNVIIGNINLDALSNKINLEILSNGIYFIEIKDKNQKIIHTDKIVKN